MARTSKPALAAEARFSSQSHSGTAMVWLKPVQRHGAGSYLVLPSPGDGPDPPTLRNSVQTTDIKSGNRSTLRGRNAEKSGNLPKALPEPRVLSQCRELPRAWQCVSCICAHGNSAYLSLLTSHLPVSECDLIPLQPFP